jgi:hypothetical protein
MTKCVDEIAQQDKDAIKEKRRLALAKEMVFDDEIERSAPKKWWRFFARSPHDHDSMNSAFSCADDRQHTAHEKRAMIGLMTVKWKLRVIAQMKMEWAMRQLSKSSPPCPQVQRSFFNRLHMNTLITPAGQGVALSGLCGMTDLLGRRVSCCTMIKTLYAELCMICFDLKDHYIFCGLVNGTIVAAACLAGTEIFSPSTDTAAAEPDMLLMMQVVFSVEFGVKLLAEGVHPSHYFFDNWNLFDVVILGITLTPNPDRALSSLRALRLLKLIKGASPKSFPQLHIVLAAFQEAVTSFQYVGALWFLIIYVYAIVGQEIFGKNDPTNFGKLHYSLWALFGASTFDGVGDLMLTQIHGCDKYGSYIEYPAFDENYYFPKAGANASVVSDSLDERRLSGHIRAHWARGLKGKKKKGDIAGSGGEIPCESHAGGVTAFFYFFSYTTLSALILLSILLGVIQGGMEKADEKNQKKAMRDHRIKNLAKERPGAEQYLPIIIEAFDGFDETDEGELPHDVFANAVGGDMSLQHGMEEMVELLKAVDTSRNGIIDLTEFCNFILSKSFDHDTSKTGSSDAAELPTNDQLSSVVQLSTLVQPATPDGDTHTAHANGAHAEVGDGMLAKSRESMSPTIATIESMGPTSKVASKIANIESMSPGKSRAGKGFNGKSPAAVRSPAGAAPIGQSTRSSLEIPTLGMIQVEEGPGDRSDRGADGIAMVSPFAMVGKGDGGYTHEPFLGAITFPKTNREKREQLQNLSENEEEGETMGETMGENVGKSNAYEERKSRNGTRDNSRVPFLDKDGQSYLDVWFAWSRCLKFPPKHPRLDKLIKKEELALRKEWFGYFGLSESEEGRELMQQPLSKAVSDQILSVKEDESDTTLLMRRYILSSVLQHCGGELEAMESGTNTHFIYSLRSPQCDGVNGDEQLLAFAATRDDFKLVFDDAVDPGYPYWNNTTHPSAPSEHVVQDQLEFSREEALAKLREMHANGEIGQEEVRVFESEKTAEEWSRRIHVLERKHALTNLSADDARSGGSLPNSATQHRYKNFFKLYTKFSTDPAKQHLYQTYTDTRGRVSLLRAVDRITLLWMMLNTKLDLDSLIQHKFIGAYYGLHDASRYERVSIHSLRQNWVWFYKGSGSSLTHGYATALPHSYHDIVTSYEPIARQLTKPLPFYRRLFSQPLDDICEYFGLELAFYFAWVGYYA